MTPLKAERDLGTDSTMEGFDMKLWSVHCVSVQPK